jgi:hypothetical protein
LNKTYMDAIEEQRQLGSGWICSQCFAVVDARDIHVTPAMIGASGVVTAHRCTQCFEETIEEIKEALVGGSSEEVVQELGRFLENYGLLNMSRYLASLDLPDAQIFLYLMLTKLYTDDLLRYVVDSFEARWLREAKGDLP